MAERTLAFDLPLSCSYIGAPPTSQVCAGTNFVGSVEVKAAFTPPVTMSATGVPAPASASYSPNPVNGPLPAFTTLTISNTAGVAPGTYPITVQGSGGGVGSDNFNLVVSANPGPPTLQTPTNSTTTGTLPNFSWSAAGGATQYRIEIDDDPAFGSPVVDEVVAATSFVPSVALTDDTLYYWRVSVPNCDAATSAVFRFATSGPDRHCRTPNQAIPDGTPAGVSDNLVITEAGTISDLDVYIRATHTFVGDLRFTLSNGFAPVAFYDRPGRTTSGFGRSGNDIDVNVNDEGPDGNVESQCDDLPATSGDRIGGDPANPTLLTAFDGQPINGTWTINSSDHAGGDLGTLLEWCLVLPDSMPFIDGFETNDTSRWSAAQP